MRNHLKFFVAAISLALFVLAGSSADSASQADRDSSNSPASTTAPERASEPADETTREEVLRWLDQYLTKEVLFRKEDIEALRAKVAQMSPTELKEWLDQSQEIRDRLDSDQWKSTRVWLEDYLPTQLYNDREMEQFRQDVGEMSPSDLLELLKRIQQKHDTIQSIYDSQFSAAVRETGRHYRSAAIPDAHELVTEFREKPNGRQTGGGATQPDSQHSSAVWPNASTRDDSTHGSISPI